MDKKLFKIIKDSEDFRKIKKELDTQMQGQCYCLINSDKFLRESFLEVLLSYAFCNEVEKPCGGCVKCEQIKNNNNIDVSYFGDGGVQVKKEDIEKLLESAITKPYENKHKFLVVKNGDGLTEQCQNMLLKMLEELPAFDTVILLFSGTQKILPTIRSRSRSFLLHSLDKSALVTMLGSSERALNIIKCTDSNIGKALELEESADFDGCLKYAQSILYNLNKSADVPKFLLFLQANKDKLDLVLYIIKGVFYMALKNEIDCLMAKEQIAKVIEFISYLEINLSKKQNKLMVIDSLLIGIVKIKNEV